MVLTKKKINKKNSLLPACVGFSVRHSIPPVKINIPSLKQLIQSTVSSWYAPANFMCNKEGLKKKTLERKKKILQRQRRGWVIGVGRPESSVQADTLECRVILCWHQSEACVSFMARHESCTSTADDNDVQVTGNKGGAKSWVTSRELANRRVEAHFSSAVFSLGAQCGWAQCIHTHTHKDCTIMENNILGFLSWWDCDLFAIVYCNCNLHFFFKYIFSKYYAYKQKC